MNHTQKESSNYPLFLLSLLLIEFTSYFLRANSLPNLGVMFRAVIFSFILANFLYVLLLQLLGNRKHRKVISIALFFWIYTVIIYLINNKPVFFDMISLSSWIAVLYLFYYYGFPKSIKLMTFGICAFLLVIAVLYFKWAINGGYVGNKPGVINAVYYLVLGLPFITLINSKFLKTCMFIFIALIVLMSQKSTAIIIVFVSLLINYLFVKKNPSRKGVVLVLGGCVVFAFIWMLVSNFSGVNVLGLLTDDVDSGGNGRFDIWRLIYEKFKEGNILKQFFGYGLNFSINTTGYSAHCDFIEILSAFGYLGLIMFLIWLIRLVKVILTNNKTQRYLSSICLMILAQACLIMLFSTAVFLANYFLLLMAMLGMVLNAMERKEIEKAI